MRQQRLTLWVIGIGLLWSLASSQLLRVDGGTLGASLVLFVLTVLPGWLWLVRGMPHLPLWEAYAAAHVAYYWLPSGREQSDMLGQPPEIRIICLLGVSVFMLAGWTVQILVLRWAHLRQRPVWSLGGMAVSSGRSTDWAWWALWGCALYSGMLYFGLVLRIVPQAIAPYMAALVRITGALGVFTLSVRMGREGFRPMHQVMFIGGLFAYSAFELLGGLMASSVVMCGNALFAYTLGARRLPIVSLAVSLAVLTFFNLGKSEWRIQYMDTYDSLSVTERLGDWIKFSWQAAEARLSGVRDEQVQTALERTDLSGILARVVATTPRDVPFWEGQTYSDGLQLLVPRFINPNRPELHAVMRDIGITYGFHSNVQASQGTNISVGPIAEAWMNRGWLALVLVGGCYGCFFAVGTIIALGRQAEQAGFLVGVSFFSFIVAGIEHLSFTMFMSFLQSFGLTLGVLFVLSVFQSRSASAPRANMPLMPASLTKQRTGRGNRLD
ncbi:MAG: hypothetical protein FJW31_18935 [Acidobacteria bacterium]|nr:hypothetical protein [Acidobacteriota bacterium]